MQYIFLLCLFSLFKSEQNFCFRPSQLDHDIDGRVAEEFEPQM